MSALHTLLALCLLLSCIYHLLTVVCAHCWKRHPFLPSSLPPFSSGQEHLNTRTPEHPNILRPVTILKPLRGADPEQYASFESFCRQEYGEYQILFGALDPDDPGLHSARRLKEAYPECHIEIAAGGEAFGLNRKVCNLASMLPRAKHDLLILCDSDMRVEPDYLSRVTAPFADSTVGLVTCPYRGYRARGFASRLETLGIGADFIPSVFIAYYLWGVRPAFGSTIALTKATLHEIGGFESLADELADDYRLAERVDGLGKKVVLSDYVVDDLLGAETFSEMWGRRMRWAKTARSMRPGPYAGAFITYTTPLALLFLASTGFRATGWIGLAAAFTIRSASATWIASRCTHDKNLPGLLPLLPISDLVSFALWLSSFFGRTILWRGERFRLMPGGRLKKL